MFKMKKAALRAVLLAFCAAASPLQAIADETPIIRYADRFVPQIAKNGMVASQEAIATKVGVDILKQGGNAVDAAVAVGFALAVTFPQAGNIGGGGFMMVHLAKENKTVAIDYREMAPGAAHRDLYLDENGDVDQRRARFSHQSAGVPGSVAGLIHALEKYGTMPLKKVIAPAVKLAEDGFVLAYSLESSLLARKERLGRNPAAKKALFKADGSHYRYGEVLKQPDLARTLKAIQNKGFDGFYKGPVADLIVKEMKANDGLITHKDLENYKVVEREAIKGNYKGYEVLTMPPPSSGGVHIVQMMNMLENDNLKELGHNSAASLHLLIEAMRQAYADRSEYLGDPDYFDVPIKELIDKKYAQKLRAQIPAKQARKSEDVKPALNVTPESPDTTHFSVMDNQGNAVSNTYTLNFSYGSHIMVSGAGFLLNNEMDDFSSKVGVANAYGLLGAEANSIEAGKRPLSSMTPTLVLKDGEAFMATGSPGGSTIITVVLQVLMNALEHEMNVAAATYAPRIHHQWFPDRILIESGISADTKALLKGWGHNLDERRRTIGSTQSIQFKDGFFYGASDSRRHGALTLGY